MICNFAGIIILTMNIREYIRKVSKILKIDPPKIKMVEKLDTETMLAAVNTESNRIYVKENLLNYDLLFSIAHEMRHIWQYHYDKTMFDNYRSSKVLSKEEYNLQPAEIDANAFAKILMIDKFGVVPLFDGMSDEVKNKIDERAEKIRLNPIATKFEPPRG